MNVKEGEIRADIEKVVDMGIYIGQEHHNMIFENIFFMNLRRRNLLWRCAADTSFCSLEAPRTL